MDIKPIRSEQDYSKTLKRIEEIWGAPLDTPEGDELDILATLVEEYEDEHYPIKSPDPIAAIKYIMGKNELNRSDIVKYLGSKSKVSEVLNGKRPLSLNMIKALHKGLGISYDILID